jgi:hypothetical protein
MKSIRFAERPMGEPADPRWAELERWTLEVYLLRAEGREAEAVGVLQERLWQHVIG